MIIPPDINLSLQAPRVEVSRRGPPPNKSKNLWLFRCLCPRFLKLRCLNQKKKTLNSMLVQPAPTNTSWGSKNMRVMSQKLATIARKIFFGVISRLHATASSSATTFFAMIATCVTIYGKVSSIRHLSTFCMKSLSWASPTSGNR